MRFSPFKYNNMGNVTPQKFSENISLEKKHSEREKYTF